MKNIPVLLLVFLLPASAFSQRPQFSLATDVSVIRSFKKEQRYWAIGQTVGFHFHLAPRDEAYAWFTYYSNGNFRNNLSAEAKSPATTPQQIGYSNAAQMKLKQISLGWKRYLYGNYKKEQGYNLYFSAGFGLMLGTIVNTASENIDTSNYAVPVADGKGRFKRLTLDLGLGTEFPVGGDIYLYLEGRALIPTTDYPSRYLFVNDNAPFTATANAGLRILFD